MGLLDSLLNDDSNRTALGLLAAAGPSATPQSFGQRLMGGLLQSQEIGDRQKQQAAAEEYRKMQMQQMALQYQQAVKAQQQQDLDRQLTQKAFTPVQPIEANAASGIAGPRPEALRVVGQQPAFDPRQFIASGGSAPLAFQIEQSVRKDSTPIKLGAGDTLLDPRTYKPLATNPKDDSPSAIKEYQFAVSQGYPGTYQQFVLEQKKAGAPSTMVKVENKTGESLAGQVGPMAKDSRIQTQGAVKMFDAASRLEAALDSNEVSAGPLASRALKVKQFMTSITGGDDSGIRQTRQAIKALAQMAVQSRKELQGQGQVTESEAAATAKAEAGDIDDLTTGELRDLVTLTKRAAHFQAKSHVDLLNTLGAKDETKGLVPFYNVQGLEPILKYQPVLPQIGSGGWSIKPKGQ